MRHIIFTFAVFSALSGALSGCNKTADKADDKINNAATDQKPAFDLAPQREQLQKAKDLEKKMQQDAEDQRKIIQLQTNSK